MRIVDRVVTSCGLALVFAGCSDGGATGASSSSTATGADTSGAGPNTALGETGTDESSTDDGDPPATTDDDETETGSGTGDAPPMGSGWCLYEVVANAEQTPL